MKFDSPHRRFNPLTRDWVLVSPQRARRPWLGQVEKTPKHYIGDGGTAWGSIYIQKGNLKLGMIIGAVTFIIAAAGSIPMAGLLFKGEGLTLDRVLPWTPWVLLIVLANGTMEEILFRGLFLRKLEPFFGKFPSNFLVALVFTVLHKGSTYTSEEYIFLAILVPIALAWGYVMQKTDSVWGSILFRAGMDIPIFLGIFSNLK